MAIPMIPEEPRGTLSIEEVSPALTKVSYVPPKEKLKEAGLDENNPSAYAKHLLDVSAQENFITIYPINTLAKHSEFLFRYHLLNGSVNLCRTRYRYNAQFHENILDDPSHLNCILGNKCCGFLAHGSHHHIQTFHP